MSPRRGRGEGSRRKKSSSKRSSTRRGRRRTPTRLGQLLTLSAAIGIVGLVVGGVYVASHLPSDLDAASDPVLWSQGRVRIEVLNAGEVAGMARTATGVLRAAGFDVVDYGNAARFDHERPSEVIDRVGRPDMAVAVAAALGIDNVRSQPDPNLYVDVSVVLGREWVEPDAAVEVATSLPWWNPRSWIDR